VRPSPYIWKGRVRFQADLEPFFVDINKVLPHPENPSNGDVEEVISSIEENTMYRPVWAQRSTGYVLGGNTTYAACLALESDVLPVVWLDVDDETATRILLGDNQIARLAMVDQGLLTPLLERLAETERGLVGTGYAELMRPPEPITPADIPEQGRTLSIYLSGDLLAAWEDVPGEGDMGRLEFLLALR
jgi:hypothetical protein